MDDSGEQQGVAGVDGSQKLLDLPNWVRVRVAVWVRDRVRVRIGVWVSARVRVDLP